MDKKIRKEIPLFNNTYLINNKGEIFSTHIGKLLNPSLDCWGYYFVRLGGRKFGYRNFRVSRLVAWIFLGLDINNRSSYVCHIDDNPLNNCVNNLFVGSPKDNVIDMMKKGRANFYGGGKRGSDVGTAKLNEDAVVIIKKRLINGESIYTIAKDNGVSVSTISLIKKGSFWKHIRVEGDNRIKPQKNVDIKKMIEYFNKGFNAIEISRVMKHSHQWICKLLKKHINGYHPKGTHS